MPVDLGPSFSVAFEGRPPHMSAVDFVLWQRFRRARGVAFLRLFFDVGVGEGSPAGVGASESVVRAWRRITQSRIDVVGEVGDSWVLIEIRGAAGPGAIGSLLVYRDLWVADPPDARPVSLWLVTDLFPDNLLGTLRSHAIRLILV